MAKTFKTLSKTLLEKQVAKLAYQIELLQADIELYKDKLSKTYNKQVEKFKEAYRKELLEKEIEQLSNDDYVKYHTEDKINKLEQKYKLKKRAVIAKKVRDLEKFKSEKEQIKIVEDEATKKLQLLDQELEQKKTEIIAPFSARNYSKEQINTNKEIFESSEQEALESIKKFETKLKEEHEKLVSQRQQLINHKISHKEKQLSEKRAQLKPIIQSMNEKNMNSIDKFDDKLLEIENLTMNFGGLKAVDQLSFDVKKGEIFGLIGPNGAGKTTVFNCITQFYKPSEGKIIFKNREDDIVSLLDYKVHDVIKQGIVRTFQNVELIWELSILDNMLVGAHSLYRSKFFNHSFQTLSFKREEKILKMRAEKILTDLDLYIYKDFYPLGLPYGVLKKIELARTLMTNPSLIILDEPAAGLNDAETESLAKTIKKIQKDYDTTIFLVEHDMGLVMSICDTICAISFGKKLAIGTPEEIQNHPVVKEAYLGGE
jgi:branched-chain amino acid transport system ATP-binding protein